MPANALRIDPKDNVAVMLTEAAKGDRIDCGGMALTAAGAVPVYHKIALRDIGKGEPVIKYGERIGVTTEGIRAGMHVHVHNVRSESLVAGEGDEQ